MHSLHKEQTPFLLFIMKWIPLLASENSELKRVNAFSTVQHVAVNNSWWREKQVASLGEGPHWRKLWNCRNRWFGTETKVVAAAHFVLLRKNMNQSSQLAAERELWGNKDSWLACSALSCPQLRAKQIKGRRKEQGHLSLQHGLKKVPREEQIPCKLFHRFSVLTINIRIKRGTLLYCDDWKGGGTPVSPVRGQPPRPFLSHQLQGVCVITAFESVHTWEKEITPLELCFLLKS